MSLQQLANTQTDLILVLELIWTLNLVLRKSLHSSLWLKFRCTCDHIQLLFASPQLQYSLQKSREGK